jgi:hypothetical protein
VRITVEVTEPPASAVPSATPHGMCGPIARGPKSPSAATIGPDDHVIRV